MKRTRTFQEDSILNEQVGIVRKIGTQILRLKELKMIIMTGKELTGNLNFEIDL